MRSKNTSCERAVLYVFKSLCIFFLNKFSKKIFALSFTNLNRKNNCFLTNVLDGVVVIIITSKRKVCGSNLNVNVFLNLFKTKFLFKYWMTFYHS